MFQEKILIFMFSVFLSYFLIKIFYNLFRKNNLLFTNYELRRIPSCMGIVFVITQTITSLLSMILLEVNYIIISYYLICMLFIAVISLLDDIIGDYKIKGFKGHILNLFKGNVTTGALKAATGFVCSFFISYFISNDLNELMINTIILVLSINFINLLDLRPGRAVKMTIVLIILLLLSQSTRNTFILISALGFLIVYLPKDLKGIMMLGDIGANTLGWTLGVQLIINMDLMIKFIALILLIIIHIIAEKYSISKIIKNNRILNYIDQLGR
ncbi:phospho-N-acetylmuramoyl-pentapeptide-transferase [Caloranaerobacter sp. DY30410]|uniref:phospho-N-acetylmuramoyl-pentapeptide- transferase n=1 Tax=Caloranaerobacter sp. DY30410 TaxID=3238305 RepID=UPI003CFF22A0